MASRAEDGTLSAGRGATSIGSSAPEASTVGVNPGMGLAGDTSITPAGRSADAVFTRHTVPEIRTMAKKINADVLRKDKDLRAMLSSRYRDLLLAANAVSDMNDLTHHIKDTLTLAIGDFAKAATEKEPAVITIEDSLVADVEEVLERRQARANQKATSLRRSMGSIHNVGDVATENSKFVRSSQISAARVIPRAENGTVFRSLVTLNEKLEDTEYAQQSIDQTSVLLYQIAAEAKLLADIPEQIYRSLETGNILNAAICSPLFRYTYNKLSRQVLTPGFKSSSGPSHRNNVLSKLPYINHQYSVALQAVDRIVSTIQQLMKSQNFSGSQLHQSVISLCLISTEADGGEANLASPENIPRQGTPIESKLHAKTSKFTPKSVLKNYLNTVYQSIVGFTFEKFSQQHKTNNFVVNPHDYYTTTNKKITDSVKLTEDKAIYVAKVTFQIVNTFRNILEVYTDVKKIQEFSEGKNLDAFPGPKNICIKFAQEASTNPILEKIEPNQNTTFMFSELCSEDTDIPAIFKYLPEDVTNFKCPIPDVRISTMKDVNDLASMDLAEIHSIIIDWYKALLPKIQTLFDGAIKEIKSASKLRAVHDELVGLFYNFDEYFEKISLISTSKLFNIYRLNQNIASLDSFLHLPITVAGGLVGVINKNRGLRFLDTAFSDLNKYPMTKLLAFIQTETTIMNQQAKENSRTSAKTAATEASNILNHVWANPVISISHTQKDRETANETGGQTSASGDYKSGSSINSSMGIYVEVQGKVISEFSSDVLKSLDNIYEEAQTLFSVNYTELSKTMVATGKAGLPPNPYLSQYSDHVTSNGQRVIPQEAAKMVARTFAGAYVELEQVLKAIVEHTESFLDNDLDSKVKSSNIQQLVRDGVDHLIPWKLIVVAGIAQKLSVIVRSQRHNIETAPKSQQPPKEPGQPTEQEQISEQLKEQERLFILLHVESLRKFIVARTKIVSTVCIVRRTAVLREGSTLGRMAICRGELANVASGIRQLPFWVEPQVWDVLDEEIARVSNDLRSQGSAPTSDEGEQLVDEVGVPSVADLLDGSATSTEHQQPLGPRFTLLPVALPRVA